MVGGYNIDEITFIPFNYLVLHLRTEFCPVGEKPPFRGYIHNSHDGSCTGGSSVCSTVQLTSLSEEKGEIEFADYI